MKSFLTRADVADMVMNHTVAELDGKHCTVCLQGVDYPATLSYDGPQGYLWAIFDTPGAYFGQNRFDIAGEPYNNYTAHSLRNVFIR